MILLHARLQPMVADRVESVKLLFRRHPADEIVEAV
jgi:hypothetical protein